MKHGATMNQQANSPTSGASRRANRLPKLTQKHINAIGWDVGNRSMQKAGRTKWSKADYRAACEKASELFSKTLGAPLFAPESSSNQTPTQE